MKLKFNKINGTNADLDYDALKESIIKKLIDSELCWGIGKILSSKAEMDKFIEAMVIIRKEIDDVVSGVYSANDNPLINSPHTLQDVLSDNWEHPYSREKATRPASYLNDFKYWPSVNRIDNVYGDRNLICTCPSMSDYEWDNNLRQSTFIKKRAIYYKNNIARFLLVFQILF